MFNWPTYVEYQLWSWKYSSIFLLLIQPHLRPHFTFYGLSDKIKDWGPTNVYYQFWSWKYCHFFLLLIQGFFLPFLGPSGISLGLGSGSKILFGPPYVDYSFWFWKYSPIFLFLIRPHLGPFCPFWVLRGYFLGGVRLKNFFGTYLHRLTPFILQV